MPEVRTGRILVGPAGPTPSGRGRRRVPVHSQLVPGREPVRLGVRLSSSTSSRMPGCARWMDSAPRSMGRLLSSVVWIWPPVRGLRSRRVVVRPAWQRRRAVRSPVTPPPTTMTEVGVSVAGFMVTSVCGG